MSDMRPTIDAIFLEAADLPDGVARSQYLDRACGGDDELRAKVQRLLAAMPHIGSFMEAPAFDPSNSLLGAAPPHAMELTGQMIGSYKLLQKLGEGGMGVVYMAQQEQPVRRRVAIKVIRAGMDSDQVAARFEQERVALALMDHPHIARVLDAGTTEDGRPYFAMELVQGIPITTYCDEEHLSLQERVELFIPICRAVQHAHQKGIIHRDLKPSNVIVGLYDGKPIPKVIDFGVAKATGQRLIERTMFTELGQIVGTMEYMAPEQAELNNLDVDTRADIYSLGVLLYELLTGSTPFTAQELREAGLSEMVRIIKESDPARPSTRVSSVADLPRVAANRRLDPSQLASAIRGELDWITLKCLEKDRGRRYESATGLATDLERYLADEPVLACPPSAAYRFKKIVRRHRHWIAAATAFVLLLVFGIMAQSVALIAVKRERGEKEAALVAEAKRRKQTQTALDAMTSRVIEDWLTKQPVLLPEHGEFLEMALSYYEEFAADTGQDEESQSAVANAYRRVGSIRGQLGQHADAAAALLRSQELYSGLVDDMPHVLEHRRELAKAHFVLGTQHSYSGQFSKAETALRKGLSIYQELVREHLDEADIGQEYGSALTRLGVVLKNLGRLEEAEAAYRQSLTILLPLATQFPTDFDYQDNLAQTYLGLASVLRVMIDRSSEAIEANSKVVAIYDQLVTEAPTNSRYRDQLAISRNNFGELLHSEDKNVEAEQELRRALALRKRLAAEFPAVPNFRRGLAMTLSNLGILLKNTNRVPEAEAVYAQALAIHKQLAVDFPTVPDHQNELAGAMINLGRVFLNDRQFEKARRLFEDAVPHHQTALQSSPHHPEYRHFYRLNRWRLAETQLELKEHAAAAEAAEQFLQMAVELPRDAYTATCLLSGCARLAAEDERLAESERRELIAAYEVSALAALRLAVENGFTDVAQLKKDTQLDPLRSRSEFQQLLADLEE